MATTDVLDGPRILFKYIKKTVDFFLIGARGVIIHHPMIVIFFGLMRERKEFVPPCVLSLACCSKHSLLASLITFMHVQETVDCIVSLQLNKVSLSLACFLCFLKLISANFTQKRPLFSGKTLLLYTKICFPAAKYPL